MSKEILMKCFCDARKSQAFYTKCLSKASTKEETDFYMDLIENSALTSKKIKDFCENSCK